MRTAVFSMLKLKESAGENGIASRASRAYYSARLDSALEKGDWTRAGAVLESAGSLELAKRAGAFALEEILVAKARREPQEAAKRWEDLGNLMARAGKRSAEAEGYLRGIFFAADAEDVSAAADCGFPDTILHVGLYGNEEAALAAVEASGGKKWRHVLENVAKRRPEGAASERARALLSAAR
jgi:hypothetical protein